MVNVSCILLKKSFLPEFMNICLFCLLEVLLFCLLPLDKFSGQGGGGEGIDGE